ncbi:MAG: HK97 gp10 family phage protein [Lactobacillus sp.]|uniref:HK97 gp10 family phage protein n=1 Tax=Lactobacillus helveticus TaxID=1587 RepID=A0A6A7K0X6_LACHE|nr:MULTISPECIES: HK97 gp10 family phage protein [Lactobacillus]MCT0196537.1 HK97 gp10 family phage protein [Lactobacillus helveticus]MDN5583992.1 HK97 gp10 family phage protein [Lactobacillus sp.]MDN5955106.1 HK97 gp10 family phage protein [Lactobacillus sp.]MDN5988598.1 HK97 gp10 family phage protein [Lactobacillus sp.]MDN6007622.1 HK97 gp10 family phage protein [Lactobacillus sp.]
MSLGTVDDAEFQAWASRVKGRIESGQLKEEIGQSTKRIGVQAIRTLKTNSPVDTGTLRKAWTAEGPSVSGGGWVIRVSNPTEYASYVESGHRTRDLKTWIPGQFFMKNSLNAINSQLPYLITPGLWAFRNLLS